MVNQSGQKFLWSVDYLTELQNELGGNCYLLALSPISFRLLADMSSMLTWNTRFDSGEVPELARVAYRQMNNPCELTVDNTSVVEAIESLGTLLMSTLGNKIGSDVAAILEKVGNGEQLTNEELMTINNYVNVGCGCGGGCGCASGAQSVPDGVPLDTNPPVVDAPAGNLPPENVTDDACAKAQFMLISWRNAILALENGDYDRERYSNWVYGLFSESWDWVVEKAAVVMDTIGIVGNVSQGTAQAIDAEFINLKCALLKGGTQAEVAARSNAVIENMGLGAMQTYLMKRILYYMPLTSVFDSSVEGPGAEYFVAGCPACVDVIPSSLPLPPVGYIWARQKYIAVSSATNGATGELEENIITFGGSIANDTRPWLYVLADTEWAKAEAGYSLSEVAGAMHLVTINEFTPSPDLNNLRLAEAYGVNSVSVDFAASGDHLVLVDDWDTELQPVDAEYTGEAVWIASEPDMGKLNLTHAIQATGAWSQSVEVETWLLLRISG